jgi:hypothetical protein
MFIRRRIFHIDGYLVPNIKIKRKKRGNYFNNIRFISDPNDLKYGATRPQNFLSFEKYQQSNM